jgi:hypothetical protein
MAFWVGVGMYGFPVDRISLSDSRDWPFLLMAAFGMAALGIRVT